MELSILNRTYLRIKDGDRSLTVNGEASFRGGAAPDFVMCKNSLRHWDAPDDGQTLSEEERRRLLNFIEAEFLKRDMRVEFKD